MTQNIMFTPDDLEFYSGILEMKATKELYMILSFLNNTYTQLNAFFSEIIFFILNCTHICIFHKNENCYKICRLTFKNKNNFYL